MFDPQRLLGQMLGGSLGGLGRKLGGANRGMSQMGDIGGLGGGTKVAAGLGLLGVAMAAFEHFKDRSASPAQAAASALPPPPPPPGAPALRSLQDHLPDEFQVTGAAFPGVPAVATMPPPAPGATENSPALHLLRSMIAAAHADGVLDAQEREAIVGRAREAGLPPEDLMALGAELMAPRPMAQLVAQTPSGLERETYAAALLAITVDTHHEQAYLNQLAQGLGLSQADRELIERQLLG